MVSLVDAHIRQNLIQVGSSYYRQSVGIPQGSMLSSILCSYFYAELEARHLTFLQADDCLLLRLIDDFLLITTSRDKAQCFMTMMQSGFKEYGVAVNPSKTLVNFAMTVNGVAVPLESLSQFPTAESVSTVEPSTSQAITTRRPVWVYPRLRRLHVLTAGRHIPYADRRILATARFHFV